MKYIYIIAILSLSQYFSILCIQIYVSNSIAFGICHICLICSDDISPQFYYFVLQQLATWLSSEMRKFLFYIMGLEPYCKEVKKPSITVWRKKSTCVISFYCDRCNFRWHICLSCCSRRYNNLVPSSHLETITFAFFVAYYTS